MRTRLLASIFAASSVFVASSAFADDPPATPPATTATPPAAAPPATSDAKPADAKPSAEDADAKGRLWIGFNVGGGVGTGANLSGAAVDGTFRIGWVLNHLMGVYGNLTGIAWLAGSSNSSASGASVSVGAVSGFLINPMFALTPVDLFEVGLGPSLDFLSGGSVSANVGTLGSVASANAFSGLYFGVDGRVALHLGGRSETGRRRGFTISADVHPSFVSGGPVTFVTGGLGADWF